MRNDKWVNVNTYRNIWCFFFVSSVFLKLNIKAKLNMERANLHCILFYDWKHIYTKTVLLRTICILNYNHIKNLLRKNNFAFVERQSYVLTLFCEKIMEKTSIWVCYEVRGCKLKYGKSKLVCCSAHFISLSCSRSVKRCHFLLLVLGLHFCFFVQVFLLNM